MRRPDWSTREWVAFALMVFVLAFVSCSALVYALVIIGPCDSPGCNIPESLFIDHYSIQQDTSGRPYLLTLWLRSYGSVGQTVKLQTLYLSNSTSQYQFPLSGTVAANTVVPLSINSSVDGFYFVPGECFNVRLITEHDSITFGTSICA